MLRTGLKHFTFILVAPILFHFPAESIVSVFAHLLVEFVDTYSTLIIVTGFVILMEILWNLLLKFTLRFSNVYNLKQTKALLAFTKLAFLKKSLLF